MLAIADELIAVGRFPPIDAMGQCLDLLIHKRVRISKLSDYWREQTFITDSIISFAEASSALGLCQTKILRVLNYYLPQRAFASINSNYSEGERYIFLRGTALRTILLGSKEPDIETLIPQRLLEDKKNRQSSQEIDEFKQVVGGLLPWYLIRSSILLDRIKDIEIAFQEADQRSKKARSQRYRQNDHLPFEIARIRFESLTFKNPCHCPGEISIIEKLFNNEYKLSLNDHFKAVRAAYRLEHFSEIRNQLEQSCYDMVVSVSNERPETKAENYIALARAVLPVSSADAAAYFNCAIEAVSKFGDELVERWEAIVAMAKRSAESGRSSPEIAYRFIRCAELVGDSVDREKHWRRNEAIQVCAKLCPSSAFAALSRWRDRDVVRWFENQLYALAHEAVSSKMIAPSVGWSLSAFSWDYQFDKFAALCIETESDETCRQYILDTAVRDIRLNDASESSWQSLKQVTEQFSLKNKELQKVLAFYAQKSCINYTEEPSQKPRIIESEESQNIDWEEIFADLDLTKTTGLNTALDNFDARPYSIPPKFFWKEVFKRVPISGASTFLEALVDAEKADLYTIRNALLNFPDSYRQRISVKQLWSKILALVARRFASNLTNYYIRENFIREFEIDNNAEMLNADIKLYIVSYTKSQKLKLVSKTSSPQTNEHS